MERPKAQGDIEPEGMEAPPEDFRRIPMTTVTRIMHRALPRNSKINTDTKDAMNQCISEFTARLTHEAARVGKEESRRIMSGDDIILALGRMGFSDCIGPLTLFLQRYHESQGIMPRGWQDELASQELMSSSQVVVEQQLPAAMPTVGVELQPPELNLTLGLALRVPRDVTELGLHEDVYKVWPRPAGPMPLADGNQ